MYASLPPYVHSCPLGISPSGPHNFGYPSVGDIAGYRPAHLGSKVLVVHNVVRDVGLIFGLLHPIWLGLLLGLMVIMLQGLFCKLKILLSYIFLCQLVLVSRLYGTLTRMPLITCVRKPLR